MMKPVTSFYYEILLVDDHPLVRQGVRNIIEEIPDVKVVGELPDGLELMETLEKKRPQMIILDISMPYLGGVQATRMVKAKHPDIKVLILTLHNRREYVDQVKQAGAEGYLLKEEVDRELLTAIETLRQGKEYISPVLAVNFETHRKS